MTPPNEADRVSELEEALEACRSSKAMMLYLKKKGLYEKAEALARANERMGETNAWRQTIIDSVVGHAVFPVERLRPNFSGPSAPPAPAAPPPRAATPPKPAPEPTPSGPSPYFQAWKAQAGRPDARPPSGVPGRPEEKPATTPEKTPERRKSTGEGNGETT